MQGTPPLLYSTLGHYQLLREAGRGGMSLVYEATDDRIGRRVALKVLGLQMSASPEAQDARVARFKRESRAIARLSHPNIVSIYDIGEEEGRHFIVMEYLDGETLRERTQQGPIAPAEAAAILRQVASGLDAVHAAGIVHRDIKPSNVMLLPGGQVKLMDFGVARQHEDTMVTQAGTMVGSPVYMSPEQANGLEHGTASDLWSLGVILYEMLAGRAPFTGDTIPNVLYQVAHATPAPLPGAPEAVQKVLDRALDKNPAQRFQSGKEMADAFDAALAVSGSAPAVRAAPIPPAPRVPRARAGSRAGRRAGAVALLLVLLGAGLFALAPYRALVPQKRAPVRQAHRLPVRPHAAHARSWSAAHAVPAHSGTSRFAALPKTRGAASHRVHSRRRASAAPQAAAVPVVRPAQPHAPRARGGAAQEAPRVRESAAPYVPHVRESAVQHTSRVRESAVPYAPRVRDNAVPYAPRVRVSVLPSPPAPSAQNTTGPDVLGTWHGSNSRNPATLLITRRQGNDFAGTMNVRTHEANVRIAVTGHVSPKTGAMTMRETQVISATKPRAWDLGQELGRVFHGGKMSGTSTDVKGRSGAWSFSR